MSRRRKPQQARGERRVAEVLEAAAAVIGEVGYEAATMTAVAERAGASIGTLYQYFPNKEAIALALRRQYADEMHERWNPLLDAAAGITLQEMVDRLFTLLAEFMDLRPAYLPLITEGAPYQRNLARRNRLRAQFADLFRRLRPDLDPTEAYRIANVALQIVKGIQPLYGGGSRAERESLVQEFKLALVSYLSSRLG